MWRIVVAGLGPIGVAAARAIRAERDLELVGLVDALPHKVGLTLDELSASPSGDPGLDQSKADPHEPRVAFSLSDALAQREADIAILCTTSRFDAIAPLLRECLSHQLHVISTCEEMLWPWYRHDALARQIDAEAKNAGRALLGAGVNPGFVMDSFAVMFASMVRRVTAVRCVRRVDAALRRTPLQQKVGATLSVEKFNQLKAQGDIGHKGLAESIALLAAGLGRQVQPGSVSETLEPVIADQPLRSALGLIQPGQVAGIHNTGSWSGQGLGIELDLTMAVGTTDPKDVIKLEGPVQLTLKIPGGLPGDSATVAAVLNNLSHLPAVAPGLRTMLDMPPAGCHNRDA
jgi:4-hydroxy-tetrahydrodipicolinate reductase